VEALVTANITFTDGKTTAAAGQAYGHDEHQGQCDQSFHFFYLSFWRILGTNLVSLTIAHNGTVVKIYFPWEKWSVFVIAVF
jgi:hypothetical protein